MSSGGSWTPRGQSCHSSKWKRPGCIQQFQGLLSDIKESFIHSGPLPFNYKVTLVKAVPGFTGVPTPCGGSSALSWESFYLIACGSHTGDSSLDPVSRISFCL